MYPDGYPYGQPTGPSVDELWECVNCLGTYTGTIVVLRRCGWDVHQLNDGSFIVICPECKDIFIERKRMRDALRAGRLSDRTGGRIDRREFA